MRPAPRSWLEAEVWTSGIARSRASSRSSGPTTPCKACNHPEICNFSGRDPTSCSNCGEQLPRLTATYLQPKGFVTSAAEPDGRDPGREPAPCAADRRSPAGDQRTARGLRRERCRKRDHRFSACLSGAWPASPWRAVRGQPWSERLRLLALSALRVPLQPPSRRTFTEIRQSTTIRARGPNALARRSRPPRVPVPHRCPPDPPRPTVAAIG